MSLQKCIYRSVVNSGNLPALIYSFIFKLYKSSSPLLDFKWRFVVFYLIRCERDIFSVLACQEKGEEHGFCEQWNICRKAERQEVIVLLLMLDLNKPSRKKKKHIQPKRTADELFQHL